MQVEFTKHFSRQLDGLRNDALREKLRATVKEVMVAGSTANISGLKKLKGHPSAYRIRIGDYKVGVYIENKTVVFAIMEHRKDIYERFPKY